MSTPDDRVVTVGAGANPLVGTLLDAGYHDVAAVDVAPAALDALRADLGDRADLVEYVVGDVRSLVLDRPADVWHDRATFHFLSDPADRARYAERAAAAVRTGGHLVIATFAPDGPTTCSGLSVERHDARSLATAFAGCFELVHTERSIHRTPAGAEQPFTHAVLRRTLR
ncbi:MAG: methyltransferase domain-containing protein [Ilumatobacteraceae bacterium]|nr:methyltransferase domain-containing protein [Ilumatobacteraceae bacterium]